MKQLLIAAILAWLIMRTDKWNELMEIQKIELEKRLADESNKAILYRRNHH